ncbi:MAG TPA: NAD(P)H-binding protein, partial [Steroidobacteraceae bacterium]|nr:NAD(P)H-binding protein [Steroidobacteraceae bacterium]
MTTRTALLAGATGLVGGELLAKLLANEAYTRVIVVTRRELGPAARARKVRPVVVDFEDLDRVCDEMRADHVFCALGTTIRKAGSQDKFRRVDYEYPRRIAELTRGNGARHFSLVSALGASRTSPFFYSRVKGELEEALRAMQWPSLGIFRPSVIGG